MKSNGPVLPPVAVKLIAPPQVVKMLSQPGLYLVSDPTDTGYIVVHVDAEGRAEQMKFDGILRPGAWHDGVIVRGPLAFKSEPLKP